MRIKALLGVAVGALALAAMAAPASANEWYGRVDMGQAMNNQLSTSGGGIELPDGDVISAGVGTRLDAFPAVRLEGEVTHASADLLGASVDDTSINANAYYDFNRNGRIQPYVTAGGGWGSSEISSGGSSEDGAGFQYNVGAGVGYALNEHVTLDGRVRYEDGERDFGSFGDLDRDATVATIGVRLS